MSDKGAFHDAARKELDKAMNNTLTDLLKELYTGETWVVRQYKAGKLTDLEVSLYANEIQDYENSDKFWSIHGLAYKSNPFLSMAPKNPGFQGQIVKITSE